ncbi:hypothetical protein OF846_000679 [Rhodotorula toruloides]|nr:hypothetical protein OF846_000679 [Rhodotorula toruloides]
MSPRPANLPASEPPSSPSPHRLEHACNRRVSHTAGRSRPRADIVAASRKGQSDAPRAKRSGIVPSWMHARRASEPVVRLPFVGGTRWSPSRECQRFGTAGSGRAGVGGRGRGGSEGCLDGQGSERGGSPGALQDSGREKEAGMGGLS